jgi:hypothetical protein
MTNPMTSPFQQRPAPRANRVTWDGTLEGARRLDEMCRNSALLPRFQFGEPGKRCQVLVEPTPGVMQSAVWEWVEVGDTVVRLRADDDDSPLRVLHKPKPTVAEAAAVLTQGESNGEHAS